MIPRFVHDLLGSPPRRGDGLNLWLFRCARVLHAFRSPAEIENLLTAAVGGESVRPGEIRRAVERSAPCAWVPGSPERVSRPSAWPAVDTAARERVVSAGWGLVDLWEASPRRLDSDALMTEEVIDALFPGNPLLCGGWSSSSFATRRREDWRGQLSDLQLIVPSAMCAEFGKTREGKRSAHTLENTGPRQYLVIEQDSGDADEQAGVLLHLAERAPLVLAVHSGSKSVHGWFRCGGKCDAELLPFMRYAVSLGADRATWTRSQFVRMPDGLRDNGKRQRVFFFNPEGGLPC